jgi:hypothetical protein
MERPRQVLAGAVVTEGFVPGLSACMKGVARPRPAGGICKNGAVNVLTKDIPTSRLGNGCAGNTALAWLENIPGPRLRLRRLIRRPMHNPGRVLGIILPCAVFNAEALRMVEIHRRTFFW